MRRPTYRKLAGTFGLLIVFACFGGAAAVARACPFCSAVSQTLRQEMATMDGVVIAEAIAGAKQDPETGEIRMRVTDVLAGKDYLKPGQEVEPVYYGEVEEGRRFLLTGVDPLQFQWSVMPVTERGERYIKQVLLLPDDATARVKFFLDYLEDPDPMMARDAYDEFALAPYDAVKALKSDMDHDQLVEWIGDPDMPANRQRLYLTMLGVCGGSDDLPLLEKMLRADQKIAGLDALIACYLTLAGEEGLPLINELFLTNKKAPYTETYSAIMAIRFHGTEGGVIPRSALLPSLHLMLERPSLADLVIADLARWGDWSQIDRLVKLFEEADDETNFIRVPVVNYIRACPEPAAEKALKRLEEIDPESVRRSNIFFAKPIVDPNPSANSTSALDVKPSPLAAVPATAKTDIQAAHDVTMQVIAGRRGESLAAAPALAAALPAVGGRRSVNRLMVFNVVALALTTLLLSAWLILTSGAPATASVSTATVRD